MIDTRRLKSLALDQDEALLSVRCVIGRDKNQESGLSSEVLETLSGLPWNLLYAEVSEFSSHLQVTVVLSLSPCTTEQNATEVTQAVLTSIEIACRPSKITETAVVLVAGLPDP